MIPTQEQKILEFQEVIVRLKHDDTTWLETITEYCSEEELDIEDVIPLISPWLRSRIDAEAHKLNLLKLSASEKDRIEL